MNFGNIAKQALIRADLPLDIEHIELAKDYAMNNIESIWYSSDAANWRQSSSTLTLVVGSDEYVLNRYVDKVIKNSMRGGSSNPRNLDYLDPIAFFRRFKDQDGSTGNPKWWTYGQMVGIDTQLEVASEIQVYSQLANKTTGTIGINAGSKKIVGTGTQFNINDVGKRFRVSGDSDTYRIGKYVSATEIHLDGNYRGYSTDSSAYSIGDVGVFVNVSGWVGGVMDSEDIELDGSTQKTGSKLFTSLNAITKSDRTGGAIVIRAARKTSNVIGIMTPAETDIERQTVKFWYIPNEAETLYYRFSMKHPKLWSDNDRVLLPEKYHDGILKMTVADMLEWSGKAVTEKLAGEIGEFKSGYKNDAEDVSDTESVQFDENMKTSGVNYYNTDAQVI